MDKAINAAKKLSDEPEKNWLDFLKESDLHLIFRPIYKLDLSIIDANLLVAFVIFSYDSDSQKIDIRKERLENKMRIAESIELDTTNVIIQQAISNSHDVVNDVVLHYLKEMTDWRWQTCCTLLDYHSNMMRFANQKTEIEKRTEKVDKDGNGTIVTTEFELSEVSKINKQKGEIIQQAIESRKQADELLSQIKKDFVSTDNAVQSDFNFTYTDTAKKKVNIESWREFIKNKASANGTAH